jgi:chromosome partitioning protein
VTHVIALANQKGGVAKTTTAHCLGAALAERGHQVLLVDLDPQACLTYSLGVDPDELHATIHDVFLARCESDTVLQKAGDLHLLPSNIELAGGEVHLLSKTGREYALKKALKPLVGSYDYVLIDCPPSLGILTINGLTAADEVLVPLQCERLSHRGVGQLLETIDDVRTYTNGALRVRGVVATMFDSRTNLAKEILASMYDSYGLEVLEPPIPKTVKLAEAPGCGTSMLDHAPRSKGATAYRQLARVLEGVA